MSILSVKNPSTEFQKTLIITDEKTFAELRKQFCTNFTKAWKILMSLLLVFAVSFCVFPGSFFDSHYWFLQSLGAAERSWYQQIVIFLFNFLDTIGRKVGGSVNIPNGLVYILAILRIGFIVV
jgi:hypothetical protein